MILRHFLRTGACAFVLGFIAHSAGWGFVNGFNAVLATGILSIAWYVSKNSVDRQIEIDAAEDAREAQRRLSMKDPAAIGSPRVPPRDRGVCPGCDL